MACLLLGLTASACFSPDAVPQLDAAGSSSTGGTPLPDQGESSGEGGSTGSTGAETNDPDALDTTADADSGGTTTEVHASSDSESTAAGDTGETTGLVDTTRRVFVSSATYGAPAVANADTLCQGLANAAGLGGQWVAWTSSTGVDALDKLTPGTGPFVLLDEASTVVAVDAADLTDGEVAAPIGIDEWGQLYEVNTAVWTGTTTAGSAGNDNCQDWTSNLVSLTGLRGNVTVTGSGWTEIASVACSASARVYCFEL